MDDDIDENLARLLLLLAFVSFIALSPSSFSDVYMEDVEEEEDLRCRSRGWSLPATLSCPAVESASESSACRGPRPCVAPSFSHSLRVGFLGLPLCEFAMG